jgi:hypothetical protein
MKLQNLVHILIWIVCLGLLAQAQAVSPPPDGGYSGANTAEGQNALLRLTSGIYNTAVGFSSLSSNTSGGFNTAVGAATLLLNTGDYNTATGVGALLSNTTGLFNTADGAFALFQATGSDNTAIGTGALQFDTTGSGNIALGNAAGAAVGTADSVICIGTFGANVSNSCYIGQIWNQPGGSQAVYVNSDGKLGALVSSKRFKEEIKPMSYKSEALFALKPVSFRYKKDIDPAGTSQFGLVAEEVENVNPDLVVRDKKGKPYSVRYDQVNAMLLNEFLKEHSKVEKLEATVAGLAATVKEQAAQIQKVSAQLEASKPAPQVVNNP